MRRWMYLVLPLVLLAGVIFLFLSSPPAELSRSGLPPLEALAVQRVELEPGWIRLHLVNDGPDPVTVAQVLVNEAYWNFSIEPAATLRRLGRAVLSIPYPWVEGDPQVITLVSSTGATFTREIPVAVSTPRPDARYIGGLAFLGFVIGVVPVFLGLLWLPFLRGLRSAWFGFFLALTLGLLLFLGIDSLVEAIELLGEVPDSLQGAGVLTIGFVLAFLLIQALGHGQGDLKGDEDRSRLRLAWAVAFGIGIHNLGEGLAVGGAYASGNVALGALLVVGFMVHNVTEGVAIVAPIASSSRPGLGRLALLGLLAGGPAIPGAWIGGFAWSALWAVFFLGVGAGAIFQVFVEIAGQMLRSGRRSLFSLRAVSGFMLGLIIMYGTGLLVAA